MKLLLSEVGIVDNWNRTALFWSSWKQNFECVLALIDFPSERKDRTKLIYEAYAGLIEVVQQNLFDLGKVDKNGKTALMFAAGFGHHQCV